MSGLMLVILAVVAFVVAYATYGKWLAKKWGIDTNKVVPAKEFQDGVDYVPTKSFIVLGHHFASIAGAGPIVGPIVASVFGWAPVALWIILGSIFVGGVHDFGSLFASLRHKGKTIGEIIRANVGESGKTLFAIFAWLTLLIIIAAFNNIAATTFVANPAVGATSIYFMVLAVLFGLAVNKFGVNIWVATVIGVILLFLGIPFGISFPVYLSKEAWMLLLIGYIMVASILPVWLLLQPRDYLNSFLLYAMVAGAILGIALYRPEFAIPAFNGFTVGNLTLFPMLFVLVACGAISGFHALVASGTTSKQVQSEGDAKVIGYGGMLIEGVLAICALLAAGYVTYDVAKGLGSPINVFANGIGTFMTAFGIDYTAGKVFVALAISAFVLTTLDTAARIGRFTFEELVSKGSKKNFLGNKYVASALTVGVGGWLGFIPYTKVWPIFGAANQLLASLALLAVAAYLKKSNKPAWMVMLPMVFMFITTVTALTLTTWNNYLSGNMILCITALVLLILAVVLVIQAWKVLFVRSESKA
ncbi:MAG: carbon starvation protein A [Deltaproteobacteria bacterium]|nr:carbon starvation protein A [Deltaproteobacteria bacterium]